MKFLKRTKTVYIVLCGLFVLLGTGLAVFPKFFTDSVGYVVGALMLLFGIVRIVGYFTNDLYKIAFQFDLALGIFASIVGISFLIHPKWLISALPLSLGLLILVSGLFSVQSAIDAKKFGIKRWALLLIFAVLTVSAGLLLIFNPYTTAIVVTRLYGVAIAATGIEKLVVALNTIKTKKSKSYSRPIEVEYEEVD